MAGEYTWNVEIPLKNPNVKMMLKRLIQLTLILVAIGFAMDARAAVIFRPVHHFGLVGYWDFQEGAGSTANDKSGYDNDGDWNGTGSHWVDGKIGKGGDFNGSDDYVDLGESQWDGSWMNHTITAWIKHDGTEVSSYDTIVSKGGGASAGLDFTIERGGAGNYKLYLMMNSSSMNSSTLNIVSDGNWHFVAIVLDASSGTFYLDGTADGGGSVSDGGNNNFQLVIGKRSTSANDQHFNGKIDEVRIYDRALSAGEVERLYKLSQPKFLAPTRTGLIGYWPFEEGTGTKAGDHSGNGNNGDLQNMEEADWVDGKLGGAVDLDGSNEYVRVTDIDATDGITKMTVSAWAKPADVTNDYMAVVYKFSFTDDIGWFMATGGSYGGSEPDDILVGVTDNDNDICYTTANFLANDTWGHWTMVYDGDGATNTDKLKFYFNGVQQSLACTGTILSTTPITAHVVTIGTSADEANRWFDGSIDEVRIYNRALDVSEIEALYKSGRTSANTSQNDKLTDGLVGLWSFNGPDMDGDDAFDRSGQNNHGTLDGPVRTIGRVGQALEFDGDNDYVDAINETNFDFERTDSFSLTAWIKSSDTAGSEYKILGKMDSALDYRGFDIMLDTSGKFTVDLLNDWSDRNCIVKNADGAIDDDLWHHVAMTYNGSSQASGVKLYVDGSERSGATGYDALSATMLNDANLKIGAIAGGVINFNGIIDEVRIYNRILSAEEVRRLYNMGR